jgi:hypothetical protein
MFDKNYIVLFFILFSFSYELRNLRAEEKEGEATKENIYIKPPAFSRISGFYSNNFKLKIYSEENYPIYYTLDSTDPRTSPTAEQFKDYIRIKVPNTKAATDLLLKHPDYFTDYEITKGKMDDVFLTVTGSNAMEENI